MLPHQSDPCFETALITGLGWSALLENETDSKIRVLLPLVPRVLAAQEGPLNQITVICQGTEISIESRLKTTEEKLSVWVEKRKNGLSFETENSQE